MRKVNSIDAALDENNYDPYVIPPEILQITGEVPSLDRTKKNKKDKIIFSNQPRPYNGRQKAADCPKNKPGVSSYSKTATSSVECFHLFMTDEMLEHIVTCTNKRVEMSLPDTEKYPQKAYAKPIDVIDLCAFFGIMYMRGLYGLNNHCIETLFSDIHGHPVFSATMSRMRFQFILASLSFDDASDRKERWQRYRFAATRHIFEVCNKNFGKALIPEYYLSLDETLYPMRTQISFRQYNPDKPAKYGMLFKSINSATYPYTYQSHVYSGKPEGDPNKYYISGTEKYIQYLVNQLASYHDIRGRNISMDRIYSSLSVANWLLEKGITMVGTMRTRTELVFQKLFTI